MQITPEYLKTISDEEVAKLMVSSDDYSVLLAAQESQRRDRLHQHELDIKLMARQVRSTRFSAIIGIIGTLAGAIVGAITGAYLQYKMSQLPHKDIQPQVQQGISSSSAVHHIRTSESLGQKAIVLKNVSSVPPSKSKGVNIPIVLKPLTP